LIKISGGSIKLIKNEYSEQTEGFVTKEPSMLTGFEV
jgi:hypothetical protein